MTVLLAEGESPIEDVKGVGKTMLARTLARSIEESLKRTESTPDVLPSDVTGVYIHNGETRDFEFRPGGVFANIIVGVEIERALPKTQSALLECKEERRVSVERTTWLAAPLMPIAAENLGMVVAVLGAVDSTAGAAFVADEGRLEPRSRSLGERQRSRVGADRPCRDIDASVRAASRVERAGFRGRGQSREPLGRVVAATCGLFFPRPAPRRQPGRPSLVDVSLKGLAAW